MLTCMLVILLLCCAGWWCLGSIMLYNLRRLQLIPQLPLVERDTWPEISIIAPACNEAKHIKQAITSRLSLDYPSLHITIVNDRSTDETGKITEQLAVEDERVDVVHIKELPEGWLGKVHALKRGVEVSESEWILFSDADVYMMPGTLRRVIHYCEEHSIEMLAALPAFSRGGVLMEALYAMMMRVLYAASMPGLVSSSRSSYGVGVGAFTLVRRDVLLEHQIFEAIRMEVADDLMLGRVLKQKGVTCSVCDGVGAIEVELYETAGDFVAGAEKNAWAVSAQFSFLRGMLGSFALCMFELSPFLLCLPFFPWWAQYIGGVSLIWALGISTYARAKNGGHLWAGLLYPMGSLLFTYASLRGTWLGWWRGGLYWRDTFYETELFLEQTKPRDQDR